jgi:hypothetical protein
MNYWVISSAIQRLLAMKRSPVIYTISFVLVAAGYLGGISSQKTTPPEPICESHQSIEKKETHTVQAAVIIGDTSRNGNQNPQPEKSDTDILYQLTSSVTDDRMNALFFIWRTNLVNDFHSEIQKLAQEDKNQHISSFAQWILNPTANTADSEQRQSELFITNFDDPEQQIMASLMENSFEAHQSSQHLPESENLVNRIYQLPEKEQISYLKKLSRSQDDAAIDALCDLVSNYNLNIKNAAIDELLSLLEFRTGHFDRIVSNLRSYQAYLSDDQAQRFRRLSAASTQSAIQPDLEKLEALDRPL